MAGAFLYPYLRRRIMSNPTIYDQATKAVVKMLGTAGTDWQQPWEVNGSQYQQYRGVNTLILVSTPYPSGT
jgi:antirestriction protein ArdC